jgi:hypothetical protein
MSLTPGADQAVLKACSRSAHERTLPRRVMRTAPRTAGY